jgi:hypothetical protein
MSPLPVSFAMYAVLGDIASLFDHSFWMLGLP